MKIQELNIQIHRNFTFFKIITADHYKNIIYYSIQNTVEEGEKLHCNNLAASSKVMFEIQMHSSFYDCVPVQVHSNEHVLHVTA